jgi:BolA protein
VIVSAAFEGRTLLEQHRLVNDAVADLFSEKIHALALRTVAPSRWEE